MARLKGHDSVYGIVSLLVIAAIWLLALRVAHLVVPAFYPAALAGPFMVDDFAAAERAVGYSPHIPFYHPAHLGAQPIHITVTTRPHPQVVTFWQGEHFLYLSERSGGPEPERGIGEAAVEELDGLPGSIFWRVGVVSHLVTKIDGRFIEIKSDLPADEVRRIARSLTPYRDLL